MVTVLRPDVHMTAPWVAKCGFICAGLLGGILLCFIVASIEYFTLNILMRQSTKHGAITYQGLVRFAHSFTRKLACISCGWL